MNKHIEAGNPDFAGYPGEDHKMDELEFLRKENDLLSKAFGLMNKTVKEFMELSKFYDDVIRRGKEDD